MSRINLIPERRQFERLRSRRIVFWSILCGGYLMIVLIAVVVSRLDLFMERPAVVAAANVPLESAAELETKVKTLSTEAARMEHAIAAIHEIGVHPDWSKLLTLISQVTGDDIVLRSCALSRSERAEAEPSETNTLHLSGFCQSQAGVSAFALRLEETGILQDVTIGHTKRVPFLTGHGISFDLSCRIPPGSMRGGSQ